MAARFSSAPKTSVLSNELNSAGPCAPLFCFQMIGSPATMTGDDLRKAALALPGTTEHPHFDRIAFKVARIYVTLSHDGETANLKLTPDEQEFKCQLAPDIFQPVDNAWGRQGWTTMHLSKATEADLRAALALAHSHAVGKTKR